MSDKMKSTRSLALIAHGGAGKTSLAEALLFNAGATKRLGRVQDGSAQMDFEPEEVNRQVSISAAFHHYTWKKVKTHIADTPGNSNFLSDTKLALGGVDNAIVVVDAVDGVMVQTEKVWAFADSHNLPRVIFVNKMDREHAGFDKVVQQVKDIFSAKAAPVFMPIGAEDSFSGVIDLLKMKAYVYQKDGSGKFETTDIPDDLQGSAEELRESLIEYIAESEDSLLEKYLEGEELSKEEIVEGLRQGVKNGSFIPVLCGSTALNIGVVQLMEMINDALACPLDRPQPKGVNPKTNQEEDREASETAPFSAQVIKTISDPYAGKLTVFRVYSGTIKSDSTFYNSSKEVKEKFGSLFFMAGKGQDNVESAEAGDIAAVAKLKETTTGDTLCEEGQPIIYTPEPPLPPVISYAVAAKTKGDEEKVFASIIRLTEEDPTLTLTREDQTKQLLLSGTGQIHLEVTLEKLKRKFGVEAELMTPKIPYMETITKAQKGVIYRHKKQTGGRGQFAEVHFDVFPQEQGKGIEFQEDLTGMNVPRNFVPAVEKGINEAVLSGALAGYPVVDVRVRFYDGKSHEVDSSEMAFKLAAIMCFRKATEGANPTLLEPIMKIDVWVPDEYMGDVIGDLNGRRGKVLGVEPENNGQHIGAHVPQAEVMTYAPELTSITGGRGTFTVEFDHYEEVPPHLREKIIAERKKEAELE
jgi:elongation factor G